MGVLIDTSPKPIVITTIKSLTGNNERQAIPIFRATGFLRIKRFTGVVTVNLGANVTQAGWQLNDGITQSDITETAVGSDLSGLVVGSYMAKEGILTLPMTYFNNTISGVGDGSFPTFQVLSLPGTPTDIEFIYTTTETPTTGSILFLAEYEPLSSNAFLSLI